VLIKEVVVFKAGLVCKLHSWYVSYRYSVEPDVPSAAAIASVPLFSLSLSPGSDYLVR
jgi:hypothetical protein